MFESIEKTIEPRALQEDEYFNAADGLIYCARCNTPRQKVFSRLGCTILLSVLCKCRLERREREEEERKQRAFMEKVSRLKACGLQDKGLLDCTFDKDLGYNPEIDKARRYVEHWEEMRQTSSGLLLWGSVGTGKTFIAGCVANALLEKGIPVLMTHFARMLNTLTNMFAEDRNAFIDSLNEYSLLIIDDLGMERSSEFALEQVFNVIDSRYRNKKPLIVTTNLTLEEMKYPEDIVHQRIYGRILERCVPIRVNRQDIRKINAEKRVTKLKTLLNNNQSIIPTYNTESEALCAL